MSACVLILSSCTDEPRSLATAPSESTLSQAGSAVGADTIPTYSQERPGTFVDMPDSLLWQHVEYSERVAVVGLRQPGRNRGVYRGRVLMDRSQWEQARRAVIARPGVELIWADTLLPTVQIRFDSFESLQQVRRLPVTDFIEPLRAIGDIPSHAEGSIGCNSRGEWSEQRLYTSDGDVYSLKHRAMGIEAAWRRTTGAGVNIGVIDTGIHSSQPQLLPARFGGRFDAGASSGRWFKFRDAWSGNAEPTPRDDCGHGTEAAGVITAARDGRGPVGVAWKSNLVATRLANGVVNVNSNDAQLAIRNTLWAMDSAPGGKVVSISWQSANWWWQVSNEIDWWQTRQPNTLLFFGAAGTTTNDWIECSIGAVGMAAGVAVSLFVPYLGAFLYLASAAAGCIAPSNDNVVFPAEHPSVIAVTCVDYGSGRVSNNCHYGSKVEFAAYQAFPSVIGSSEVVDRLGGSSGATPVVAGQAALVWSKYPSMTRAQVLDRMRWAGRATRDAMQGYGIVDVHKAAGGMYNTNLHGCTSNDCVFHYKLSACTNQTFYLSPMGGDGPYTYSSEWVNQGNQGTHTMRLCPRAGAIERYSLNGIVTDQSDGTRLSKSIRIEVTSSNPDEACPTCPK